MLNLPAFFLSSFLSLLPSPLIPSAARSGGVVAMGGDEDLPSVRQARAAGGQVTATPVDCVLSEWSVWSRCDTCQKKRVSVTFQRGGQRGER